MAAMNKFPINKSTCSAFVVVVVFFGCATAATVHTVGDSTAWTVPTNPSFYSDWASKKVFAVGDTLVFTFPNGAHNVIRVPESSYSSCSTANQVGATFTTSPVRVPLDTPGVHYIICGVGQHCSLGQKVAVTVNREATVSSAVVVTSAGLGLSAGAVVAVAAFMLM